jgi:hypothetical protein
VAPWVQIPLAHYSAPLISQYFSESCEIRACARIYDHAHTIGSMSASHQMGLSSLVRAPRRQRRAS